MSPAAREGVTRFRLENRPGPAPARDIIRDLDHWRTRLHKMGLIGRDARRYDGAGFGNVSRRVGRRERGSDTPAFVTTGTQTGHLPRLSAHLYTFVTFCLPDRNVVRGRGPVAPSSESMTHAVIYEAVRSARFVFHAHSPEIWRMARRLGIAMTHRRAEYGTVAMTRAVRTLLKRDDVRRAGILAMGGHPDGVVSWGRTGDEAGARLLTALRRSREAVEASSSPGSGFPRPRRSSR